MSPNWTSNGRTRKVNKGHRVRQALQDQPELKDRPAKQASRDLKVTLDHQEQQARQVHRVYLVSPDRKGSRVRLVRLEKLAQQDQKA